MCTFCRISNLYTEGIIGTDDGHVCKRGDTTIQVYYCHTRQTLMWDWRGTSQGRFVWMWREATVTFKSSTCVSDAVSVEMSTRLDLHRTACSHHLECTTTRGEGRTSCCIMVRARSWKVIVADIVASITAREARTRA